MFRCWLEAFAVFLAAYAALVIFDWIALHT